MPHVPGQPRTRSTHGLSTRPTHGSGGYSVVRSNAEPVFDQQVVDGVLGPGDIPPGTVSAEILIDYTVPLSKLAATLRPPLIVDALPDLPDDDYAESTYVVLASTRVLYKNVSDVWTTVTPADALVAGEITAGIITAGAIGADELAANIILGSLIKTSDTGARVEFDANGIRLYNSSDELIVLIPTNGDDVRILAEVEALALTVTGDASLQGGANEMTSGSVMTLQSAIANPTVAPTVTQDLGTLQFDYTYVPDSGFCYDSAGGSGGVTEVFWTADGNRLIEYLTDGTVNRSLSMSTQFDDIYGMAREASGKLWVTGQKSGTAKLYGVTVSSLTADALSTTPSAWPKATPNKPMPVFDGTDMYIVDTDAGTAKWYKYSSWVTVGSVVSASYNPGASYVVSGAYAGSADFGAWRMCVHGWNGSSNVLTFDSTGTRQTATEWTRDGGDADGLAYDGNWFYTLKANYGYCNIYSAITTEGVYWVAYSWYDSAGTTHETTVSPRRSIDMGKRYFMYVTMPSLPGAGGADDPDYRRLYMKQAASDPGVGGLYFQSTPTSATHTQGTYDSGGAADPASNDFPGGTPAEIAAAGGEWALYGDGTVTMPGPVVTVFTSDGTWTLDPGLNYIVVECVGGGGGGGGASTTGAGEAAVGGGGGGGAYTRKLLTAADLASLTGGEATVDVGAGGSASTGGAGGDGASSTFSGTGITTVTAGGGTGGGLGADSTGNAVGSAGDGGTGSGGDFSSMGDDGQKGYNLAGTRVAVGNGGKAGGIGGGGGFAGLGAGGAGGTYGGGGGGGGIGSSVSGVPGGAGAQGIVIVTEYYS